MGDVPMSEPATVDSPSTTNANCCLGNCLFSFTKPAHRSRARIGLYMRVAGHVLPNDERQAQQTKEVFAGHYSD